ncbi:MAG: adenylate/guanylate cyclase domain-containing protein [Anaerolineales bacterium]
MNSDSKSDLPSTGLPSGTVTFLFTDIEGSTELVKQLGDEYATVLADQRRTFREIFSLFDGQEVDTQGDSFFVSFPRATQAVEAVVQIQRALDEHTWPKDVEIRVRMGLHTGEPLVAEEGYVGMDVHRAARIAHIGHGGQVLLSETTAALILDELLEGLSLVDMGRHLLKDMSRPEHIRQLTIEGLPSDFPPLTSLEMLPSIEHREPRSVGESPYQGLAAFDEQDAEFFFGREDFTERLLGAVKTHPMIAVIVGSSGSGKSSAVFAGLLPRLRKEEGWSIAQFRPGSQPLAALTTVLLPVIQPELQTAERLVETRKLADALRAGDLPLYDVVNQAFEKNREVEHLLLVIDQFEELYTLCQEEEVRRRFKDELLAVVEATSKRRKRRFVLLLTMRADFMGQALTHRPFADALQEASLLMGPMTREELESVVQKPAEIQGAIFEAGLVERILDDVGEKPGNLPLLEFALTLLWEAQSDGWLTHTDYEAIGSVDGALARHADEVFEELEESEREQARRIFVQLVKPGEGTEDTRRVAIRSELAEADWGLIQHLADRRLVVTGRDADENETVEVVHEALIQRWELLREWMQENRAFRSWQERLRTSLRDWDTSEQDKKAVLRGLPLTEAENWLVEREEELSTNERAFIQASLTERQIREQAKLDQKEYEISLVKRSRRFLRGLVGVFIVASILGTSLTAYSLNQRRIAEQEARASRVAYSMSIAAHIQNALDVGDTATALALAMVASDMDDPPPEVKRMLRQSAYAPGPIRRVEIADVFEDVPGVVYALDVSPTSNTALIGFDDGTIIYWRTDSIEEIYRMKGHTGTIRDVVFSPDGSTALSASDDGTVIHWDLQTGEALYQFTEHHGWVRTVAFSPDGRWVASGGFIGDAKAGYVEADIVNPGELVIWQLDSGKEIQRFDGHPTGVVDAVFTPDGRQILSTSGTFIEIAPDYSTLLWDISTGEIVHEFDKDVDSYSVAISPDGSLAAPGAAFPPLALLDLQSGETIAEYGDEHENYVRMVEFSPDGKSIVTGDSDGKLMVWDAQSLDIQLQATIHGQGDAWSRGPMFQFGFDSSGRGAISSAGDGTLVFWDLKGASEIRQFSGHEAIVGDFEFSPDGSYVFTSSGMSGFGIPGDDNSIRMWDIATGELLEKFEGHSDGVVYLDVSQDGTRILSGSLDGSMRLWDVTSGTELLNIPAHEYGVFSVALSPDGNIALSGSVSSGLPDDGVKLWDLTSGEMIHHYFTDNNATFLMFSPDGKTGYSPTDSGLSVLDIGSGSLTRKPIPSGWDLALHSDGTSYFSFDSADANYLQWMDLETGEALKVYGVHKGTRNMLELSPDERYLLSSEGFDDIHLWDVETGDEIWRIDNGALNLNIALSPDGRTALSSGPNNTAVLWRLDLPVEVDAVKDWIAENRYVRELSCGERLRYSIEPLCEAEDGNAAEFDPGLERVFVLLGILGTTIYFT